MDYRKLTDDVAGTVMIGDHRVRRMGYGAMRLSGPGVWGPPGDLDDAIALLRHVVDSGVNLIDTAEAYGPGANEQLIADALHPYPDELLVATKGGLARSGPDHWSPAGRPTALRAGCDASLQRLRLDTIGLYQLHTVDPEVPLSESVGALADLQAEGKIRHIGLSNVTVDQLDEAQQIVRIVSVQNRYNVAERESDPVLDRCEADGLAFLPWYPLAPESGFGDLTTALDEVAAAYDTDRRSIALAWLLARSPQMVPIPGTSSRAHFDQNLSAAFVDLGDEHMDRLTGFTPELGKLLDQLGSGPLEEERRQKLTESSSRLSQIWERLRFWS